MTIDDDFRVRPGRMRDRGSRGRSFVGQVLRAAVRAGYLRRGPSGGGGRGARGRGAAIVAGLRSPGRRVTVKARIVRHAGRSFRAAPLGAHLAYLKRDGVDRSGEAGRLFDRQGDADGRAFAARCEADRHHFRFIVSPEDAADLADLREFGRQLMARAEADLGTRLDWVAVDHWNTAHPHLHVLLRGVDEAGEDLVIAREYIAHGLRGRAEAMVSLELGPRSAREIAGALERDTTAERWTELDRLMLARFPDGRADLRPGPGAPDRDTCALLAGRAMALERLGLARSDGPGVWTIAADAPSRLRDLADRREALARLARLAPGRAMAELDPDGQGGFTGRMAERGLHDEHSGEAYVVVDALDGRLRHVRVRDLEAAGDTPPGGVVEVRPAPGGQRVLPRSDLGIDAQVRAEGATWLDRRLVVRAEEPLVERGFGAEVTAALADRREVLRAWGLATGEGASFRAAPGLLATLRAREIAAAAAQVAMETGLRFRPAVDDELVGGLYLRRLDLASGRFVVVQEGAAFQLLPWASALDRRQGRAVSGRLREGRMGWDLGRSRER